MSKNYATIGKFGDCLLVNTNYGYDVCMFDGIDKCFAKGPGPVDNLGPSSPNCQSFLAEQCSVDWNSNCETYYRVHNNSNQRYQPNLIKSGDCQVSLLLGDSLLLNSAELRFFTISCDNTYTIPLDPTNYSSPMITKFVNRRHLEYESLSDRFDKNTIDNDAIMCRLLQNPKTFLKFLYQIYIHVKANIKSLTCQVKDAYGDSYIEYNPIWDIRGTRTWETLVMLFEMNKPNCDFN